MAASVASSTPASAPRQPAWAAPITPASDRQAAPARSRREHAEGDAGAVGQPAHRARRRAVSAAARARPRPWCRAPGARCTGFPAPCRGAASARAGSPPPAGRRRRSRAAVERGEYALADAARRVKKPWRTRAEGAEAGAAVSMAAASASCESRRRRRVRPGEHQHLEQLAHGARRRSGGTAPRATRGAGPASPVRAASPCAGRCRARAGTCPAAPARRPRRRLRRGLGERPKVDMGGKIGVARARRAGRRRRAGARLQGVAGRLGPGAVVDQQRHPAVGRRCAGRLPGRARSAPG